MKELLKTLCETWGPSGYEYKVRKLIESEVAGFADEVRIDPLGNLIVRVGSGGPKVMVIAHMDEIGVMATFAEKASGMLRFAPVGGLIRHILPGSRVQFEDGTIGVVGAHDIRQKNNLTVDDLFIDVAGADVKAGQPAVFVREFIEQGDVFISKALDDRLGCLIAIQAIQRLNRHTPNEVYFVFSVQEEIGMRGAAAAAYGVDPDVAIAVDVTDTGDLPKNAQMAVKMGGGAAIKVHDPGLVVPRAIIDWMVDRAEADGIPYQMELLAGGSTDAARVQNSRAGVPSGCISIPTRYIHTTSEMAHQADIAACIDLLVGLTANPVEI